MHLLLNNQPVSLPADFQLRLTRCNPLYSDSGTFTLDLQVPLQEPAIATLLTPAPAHPQSPTTHRCTPFTLQCPEAGFTTIEGMAVLTEVDELNAHFTLTADTLTATFAAGDTSEDISSLPGANAYIDRLTYPTYPTTAAACGGFATLPLYPSCYVAETTGTAPAGSAAEYLQAMGETGCVFVPAYGDSVEYLDDVIPPSPRLAHALERILHAATSLTLAPQDNCLRYHPQHATLCILNVRNTGDLAYMLPHWTLQELLLELRRLLGIVIRRTGDRLQAIYFHQPTTTDPTDTTTNPIGTPANPRPLTPLLPRTYTLQDAETNNDDPNNPTTYQPQLDPTRANTAYQFPDDANPIELLPDTLRALAQHMNNSTLARLYYHGSHHGIEIDKTLSPLLPYNDGPHHWQGSTAIIYHTLTSANPWYPLDSTDTQQYIRGVQIDIQTHQPHFHYDTFPLRATPPISIYLHNDTNTDPYTIDPHGTPIRIPTETNLRAYECDYLAPAIRHDTTTRPIDYQHRITPCADTRSPDYTDPYKTHLHTTLTSEGEFFQQLQQGRVALFPLIERLEDIPTTLNRPTAPDTLEIFVW